MSDEASISKKASTGRMLLPSLSAASLAVNISGPVFALLTVDIATTFFGSANQGAIGATSQLGAVNSAAEVVFALMMGVLAVRFKHKSLLLAGLALVAVSAIIGFFAPTLFWLQIFAALEGGGTVMVGITSLTVIGESLPFNKKAKAVSYVVAATSLASLIGMLVIGFVANLGGWRSVLMFFVMPVAVASLILASFALPSRIHKQQSAVRKETYLESFKQVLLNKSAASCVIGGMLISAAAFVVFVFAFYRTQFSTSLYFTVGIMMIAAVIFIVASLLVGRLANRYGAKTLAVVGAIGNGILMAAFFFIPNLWAALTVHMVGLTFGVVGATAFQCLALDQAPKSRGTMMSVKSVFLNIGGAIGTAVGGLMLIYSFSYQAVGIALGGFSIAAAAVWFFLTKQPTET
jgi:predicted MFS family arabinose efflux permease